MESEGSAMTADDRLRERAEAEGQGHVFRFWDELDGDARARLAAEVAALDFDLVRDLRQVLAANEPPAAAASFEPPDLFPLERDAAREQEAVEARARGEEVLAEGLVGYVLVAGGQGSRLGFEGAKGRFPIGPVTGASLFEWHARRLSAARARYGAPIAWYVMTSATNDAETRAFFRASDWFGLEEEDVRFFQQAMLPALSPEGEILMASKDSMFLAPNGHGGTLAALADSGCLADARDRGLEVLSYFQVDSPLVRPADPLFIGLHVLEGASMSTKVIAKRDADEKVGVIGRADGKLGCIEYSDLPDELRLERDESGELVYGAGNAAIHLFERLFVEELTEGGLQLPWHLARKKMKVVDEDGAPVEREGVKFETFVFDALGRAERSVTLEVDRKLEFSPAKNAEGEDSPATVRRDLTEMFASWARAGGVELPPVGADGCVPIEVDPCFAEDEGEFLARMPATPARSESGVLYR